MEIHTLAFFHYINIQKKIPKNSKKIHDKKGNKFNEMTLYIHLYIH